MITGRVTADREAIIGLEIAGPSLEFQPVEAVIDTGYNGSVGFPGRLIEALELPLAGHRRGVLADGSLLLLDLYLATVLWHGKRQEVLACRVEGAPIVGMSLLGGSRLTIDVVDGGEVAIEELT